MNFVNAELAKISVNTYVTTKISYANMLAEICEKVPGADSDVVGSAIGLDTRIGRKYMKGAVGYGGPCFPRDNVAFSRFAELQSVDATLAKATDQVNRRQVTRLADRVAAVTPAGGIIGILGLSYKPDTEVIEESQGLMLASHLLQAGFRVVVYDPAAMNNARRVLNGRVEYAASMEECAGKASVLVIATAWKQFRSLAPEHLRKSSPRPVVVDWWRVLPEAAFAPVADYLACGRGPAPEIARKERALAAESVARSV
jgi:UDPglucose 6-dehydrogenase